MIIVAGDLSVYIDTWTNAPGSILERLKGGEWRVYLVDGKPVTWPVKVSTLKPGKYRLVEK